MCQMPSRGAGRGALRECAMQDHHVGKESHERPQRNKGEGVTALPREV